VNADKVTILPEQPDSFAAVALIDELEAVLDPLYPRASRHGYSVEKLLQENVAFFILRLDGEPAGCGGVQFYGQEYGEVKRIFIRPAYRGKGLSKRMMLHLEDYSLQHGIHLLRLETGIYQPEAIGLYEKLGYHRIGPFGEYRDDPLSIYFEKSLSGLST
jgi:putative acetyltransferase